jgi:hypothetical protein
MRMSEQGYVKIHRKIRECWIWAEDEKFSKCQAWIDLIMSANHKDKKIPFNDEIITIKRGQFVTSIRKLSERWHWSKSTVVNFLKLLESDEMIHRDSDSSRTVLTVINYDVYQVGETVDGTASGTPTRTVTRTVAETNKNEEECTKNDKNNIYSNRFEEIWSHYPRKEDKGLAYRCYMARINDGYSEDELLEATIGYEKECNDSHREKRYIKKGATFYGVNTPFVDFIKKKEFRHQIYNLDLQDAPPYFGFPESWFNGTELDESRVTPVIRPVNLSLGWYTEEEVSKSELIEIFKSRRRYYESHSK